MFTKRAKGQHYDERVWGFDVLVQSTEATADRYGANLNVPCATYPFQVLSQIEGFGGLCTYDHICVNSPTVT